MVNCSAVNCISENMYRKGFMKTKARVNKVEEGIYLCSSCRNAASKVWKRGKKGGSILIERDGRQFTYSIGTRKPGTPPKKYQL